MKDDDSSSDGYVRIPASILPGIPMQHLVSECDPTVAISGSEHTDAVTGYTEWTGSWESHTLTLGWDWAVVRNCIALINPYEIRTNIKLTFDDGRPESSLRASAHLLSWIETLPWREAVSSCLDED